MTVVDDRTSILQTKLYRAPLPQDHVQRPHLLALLNQVRRYPLTLVCAPAGYGKSVLMRGWSEQSGYLSTWLSLDEDDNDPGRFASYLLAALKSVIPSFGSDLMDLAISARLPAIPTLVEMLFAELSQIQADIVLMVDDYSVILNDAVHQLIAELLNHPHPRLHIVLGTRYDPPLPLNEWRARDQLLELRSVDLRFSMEETKTFLRQALDVPLSEETIAILHAKTEGWAAGLRLAILSFTRIEDLPGQIDKISGSSSHIRDYLASQVLSNLPAERQLFLLQTSILDRLSASLCQAVIMLEDPILNAQTTLVELEASNVFMIPLDDSQQWFRYHQLFDEFLQTRLQEGYSPKVVAALHMRARKWFAKNGFIEEALHHSLAAGETDAAVEIVAANRHGLVEKEEYQRLAHWLNLFTLEVIEGSPDLLLIQAFFAQTFRFDVFEIDRIVGKIDALLGSLRFKRKRALHLEAETLSLRGVVLFYFDPDLNNALACFRSALEMLPKKRYALRSYSWIYGAAALQMLGDQSGAYEWIEQARREDLAAPDGPRVRNAFAEAMRQRISANLTGLKDVGEFLIRNTVEKDYWETRGWSHHFLANVYYERNDLESAERHAREVFNNRDHHPAANVDNDLILVKIHQARGEPEQALEMLKRSLDYATEQRSPTFTMLAQSFQVELAFMQGRAHEVVQWAEQAYANLRLAPMHTFYIPELTIPKVLLAVGTKACRKMAAKCLQRIHEYAESTHNTRVMIEVLALEALCQAADYDKKGALEALEKSLTMAQTGGYIRLFVDLGPDMTDLLRLLLDTNPGDDYIASIIQAFPEPLHHAPSESKEQQIDPLRETLSEPLTVREVEILELLAKRYSNKEIAAELVVAPTTVKGHTINLYRKLSVHNRRDAVHAARILGLIPSS